MFHDCYSGVKLKKPSRTKSPPFDFFVHVWKIKKRPINLETLKPQRPPLKKPTTRL